MLEAHLALRILIKREILRYVKTGRTKSVELGYFQALAKTCTRLATMELYPTKDYLDICKVSFPETASTRCYLTTRRTSSTAR
jgi:hypothetical protein